MAVWRPHLGCTQLPIGATLAAAQSLRKLPAGVAPPSLDKQAWPMGDAGALARPAAPSRKALDAVLDEAFRDEAGAYKGKTWGVVVLKDGKIVGERYDPGFGPHISARTNSMCKSLSVTLVGAAVHQGLVDIDQRAPLEEWRRPGDPRGNITLDDTLRMASGLYTEDDNNPQPELYGSGAPAYEVSALNMISSQPGQRFVYAGSDTILSTRAIRQAAGDDAAFIAWPYEEVLWKIGMTRTVIETDWNNDFLISGQCWSTARDFARLGQLYLNDGVWNGERILPEGWAEYVSTEGPAQPTSEFLADSKYGAQFWLYDNRDGLPDKAYAAAGAFGQYAMIVPSQDLVVVRRGLDGREGFEIARFTADVIAALD
jgi:CubicO group peptidase (beta-lactamase class C family)